MKNKALIGLAVTLFTLLFGLTQCEVMNDIASENRESTKSYGNVQSTR